MKQVSQTIISVENLSKNFEVIEGRKDFLGTLKTLIQPRKKVIMALKSISFSIEKGELVGFIGPNGAGKTTTLKILSGLLYPTSGFVQVSGFKPWDRKPEFLKQITLVMGQKNQLWWDLPAIETIKLERAIYEIPKKIYEETLVDLVELLEVEEILEIPVRNLSLGQRMRLELLVSLLHRPKILFLDEPTIGLDVFAQQKIRDFIFEYNRKFKTTVILTSHNMNDLLDLVKRVIVINKGEIFFDGELKKLIEKFAREKIIRVYLSEEVDFKKFEEIGNVKTINYPSVVLSVPREASAVASSEILQRFPVSDLTVEEEPLESIIRRIFREELLKRR